MCTIYDVGTTTIRITSVSAERFQHNTTPHNTTHTHFPSDKFYFGQHYTTRKHTQRGVSIIHRFNARIHSFIWTTKNALFEFYVFSSCICGHIVTRARLIFRFFDLNFTRFFRHFTQLLTLAHTDNNYIACGKQKWLGVKCVSFFWLGFSHSILHFWCCCCFRVSYGHFWCGKFPISKCSIAKLQHIQHTATQKTATKCLLPTFHSSKCCTSSFLCWHNRLRYLLKRRRSVHCKQSLSV